MSNPIQLPPQSVRPHIQSRQELEAVVENITQLQLEREELERRQELEIIAIRQKYRVPLAEVERYLLLETSWAETWAGNNPHFFSENRTLACTHAQVGFRTGPPRVDRLSRKWTWSEIADKLAGIAWGRAYLRQPAPEVNKEAVLAAREKLTAEELRQVGLKIIQNKRFYITPHHATETTQDNSAWQEAA